MAQFTEKSTVCKPSKPRPDFPLFPHASGKWAKTIRGKTHYFGSWSDPHGAEEEYLAVADDLHAGRVPSAKSGAVSLRDVCNKFINAKRVKLESGNLSPRTLVDADRSCKMLLEALGPQRAVADLGPTDFEKLYAALVAKGFSRTTLKNEITSVKSIFKYAFESDLIERPVKYGPTFRAPSATDMRKEKAKKKHANGSRAFEAGEIRTLLEIAPTQLRAMILLGVNAGLGNSDLAALPISALDLKKGWLDFPRVKTGVERRAKLWPETVEALKAVLEERKDPANPDDANTIFITRLGQRWVRYELLEEVKYGKRTIRPKQDDAIAKGMAKLLKQLGLKRPGLSFYSLRHTFETVAGGSRDQVAVDAVLGHVDPTMAANYRHGIEDARLEAVTAHVRNWLFG